MLILNCMLTLVINSFILSGRNYIFLCKVLALRGNLEEIEYEVFSPHTTENLRSHLIVICLIKGHRCNIHY